MRTDETALGLPVRQAEEPESQGLLLHGGQLADPRRADGRHDEAAGSEDPAEDRVPDPAAEHGEAEHVRRRAIRRRRPRRRSSRSACCSRCTHRRKSRADRNVDPGRCPVCSPCAACRRRSEPCKRSAMSTSTAAPARSTHSSARTAPGSRRCSGSRAASFARTQGAVEIGGRPPAPRPPRQRHGGSGSASRIRRTRTCIDLSVAENLYLAVPARRAADLPADARRGRRRDSRSSRSTCRCTAAGGIAVPRRAAAARGREGAARPAEGAAPRRADDGARAAGRRAAPRAGRRAEQTQASASST